MPEIRLKHQPASKDESKEQPEKRRPKYAVGQRVKTTTFGDEGEVRILPRSGDSHYLVQFKDYDVWAMESELEPITPSPSPTSGSAGGRMRDAILRVVGEYMTHDSTPELLEAALKEAMNAQQDYSRQAAQPREVAEDPTLDFLITLFIRESTNRVGSYQIPMADIERGISAVREAMLKAMDSEASLAHGVCNLNIATIEHVSKQRDEWKSRAEKAEACAAELEREVEKEKTKLSLYESEGMGDWNMDRLADLYYEQQGSGLIDFVVDRVFCLFNKALGKHGWSPYESDGSLEEALSCEVNSLLIKAGVISDEDYSIVHDSLHQQIQQHKAGAERQRQLIQHLEQKLASASGWVSVEKRIELVNRITNYLATGGLWNPEMMEPERVRDILIECRDALAPLPTPASEQGAWTLPEPPKGRAWHREDWTEEMLEGGWRPLLKGERSVPGLGGDEFSISVKDKFHWQASQKDGDFGFWRTRRELPVEMAIPTSQTPPND